ncbi:hypothetical protein [Pseudomonas sp. NPDC079086]|uniref:hypothetical protein n=1 Tax=unclassified Pseudomonas TaxID=196821 RepID=UPI0037CBFA8D
MKRTEPKLRPLLRLSTLIDELRAESACSSTTAAYFFNTTFQAIKDSTDVAYVMPLNVCWVGQLNSSKTKGSDAVLLQSLIKYFESRMSPFSTPEDFVCFIGAQASVPDHLIYFDRDQFAQLIRQSGSEVPGFLETKANMESKPDSDSMDIRQWKNSRKIARSLIEILIAASRHDGDKIRRSALQLGQKGQPYTDARILMEIAETLGLEMPRKLDTLVKFISSPEGGDE